jgi:hypothetical protein
MLPILAATTGSLLQLWHNLSSFSSRRRRIDANAFFISPYPLQTYSRIDDSSSTAPSTPTKFTVLLFSSISRTEKPYTDFASDFLYQNSRVIQDKDELYLSQ